MPMLSVNAAIEMENTYQINKNDSNISYIDLIDMMDFSRMDFDKFISLNAKKKIKIDGLPF